MKVLQATPGSLSFSFGEEAFVGLGVKVTARQMRFLLSDGKRAWMVQPLHVPDGVPRELQGYYAPPTEQQNHGWGALDAATELAILRDWVARGYKQEVEPVAGVAGGGR
jgi:hypothetical protein